MEAKMSRAVIASIDADTSSGSDVRKLSELARPAEEGAATKKSDQFSLQFLDIGSKAVLGTILLGTAALSPSLTSTIPDDSSGHLEESRYAFIDAHLDLLRRAGLDRIVRSIKDLGARDSAEDREEGNYISTSTLSNAIAFVSKLPGSANLPKFAPDGEGGLVLSWKGDASTCLVVIGERYLHIVLNAGTDEAIYLDDVPYVGGPPPAILSSWYLHSA
jgi:hypothetical protein